ncbi:hypothetical protein BJY00DRAFT_317595 [Aspergillus carlsbadensis]|nr:hypothetical protein BJY00DRAFT_317595 [Aspergillus carlsbadensis]
MPSYHTRRSRDLDTILLQEPTKKQRIQGNEQDDTQSPHEAARPASPRPAGSTGDRPAQPTLPPLHPTSRPSYLDKAAAIERLPLPHLVWRYKEWRLSGSPHDLCCRVCGLPDRLVSCHTCSFGFHWACKHDDWIRDPLNRWFCPTCARYEWHISPPSASPPASPKPPPDPGPGLEGRREINPETRAADRITQSFVAVNAGSRVSGRVLARDGAPQVADRGTQSFVAVNAGPRASGRVLGDGSAAPAATTASGTRLLEQSPGSGVVEVERVAAVAPAPAPGGSSNGEGAAGSVSGAVREDVRARGGGDGSLGGELVRGVVEPHNQPQQQRPQEPPPIYEARGSGIGLSRAIQHEQQHQQKDHQHHQEHHRDYQNQRNHQRNNHNQAGQHQQQEAPPIYEAREPGTRVPSTHRQDGGGAATTQRHREPRSSALSSEVEDSVSVIYRELESVPALRKQNEQLREERTRLLEGLTICDQEILYLQRQMGTRPSEVEVQRLKDYVARLDRMVLELREENAALKSDLKVVEEQAAAAKESLNNEWRGKLARLMQ